MILHIYRQIGNKSRLPPGTSQHPHLCHHRHHLHCLHHHQSCPHPSHQPLTTNLVNLPINGPQRVNRKLAHSEVSRYRMNLWRVS